MNTTCEGQEFFRQFTGRTVETMTAWAETQQKIVRELAELAAGATQESAHFYAGLQATGVEAFKEGQAALLRSPGEWSAAVKSPAAWYQKALQEGTEQVQKAFRCAEGNAQAFARSAERIQTQAEKAAREIQQAVTAVMEKTRPVSPPPGN